jgi:WD40-like Beta Propeller Repeat
MTSRVRSFILAAVLAGGLAVPAVLAPAAAPAVRASVQTIAYSDVDGDLFIGTLQGHDGTAIYQSDGTTAMTALSISPDGSTVLALASSAQDQLVLVPVSGGTPVAIDGTVGADSGSFSPDGTSVVFSIGVNTSPTLSAGIYSVPVAGGVPAQLVATPDTATDSLPQLSPNGAELAFVRDGVDTSGNETVGLEVVPVSGGTPTELTDGLAPTIEGGEHLSFSPDGRTIVYSGDYTDPGIYTISAAGGTSSQLTSDSDYWPSFSADGSTVIFSRDAFSPDADDNAAAPVDLSQNDVDELWSMNANGSNATAAAEGDFETIAVTTYANGAGTTGGVTGGTGGTSGTGGTGSIGGTGAAGNGAIPSVVYGRSVHVAVRGTHYIVTWKGKAPAWMVLLRVGDLDVMARVKGSVHRYTFTVHARKGITRAVVSGV